MSYPTEGARIAAETGKSVWQHVRDDFLDSYADAISAYAASKGKSDDEVRADLETMLSLGANRMTNMVGGRHSDSMRSETNALRSMGITHYIADWNRQRGIS